jgi:hypothetical protein
MPESSSYPSSRREFSTLESLPVEVLQKIFFISLELNLPRASKRLSQALSIPLIYTWLIRLAFSSLNESSSYELFRADNFLPSFLNPFELTSAERTHLQNEILNCRWCTLAFMRKCQREYLEHILRQKCVVHKQYIFDPNDLHTLTHLDPYFADLKHKDHGREIGRRGKGDLIINCKCNPDYPGYHQEQQQKEGEGGEGEAGSTFDNDHQQQDQQQGEQQDEQQQEEEQHLLPLQQARPKRRSNSEERKLAFWFHFGAIQIREHSPVFYETDVFRLPACQVDYPARIPDRLLFPPWTDDKLELLTLLAPEAYIDQDNRYDRAKRVLRDLIKERNLRTFRYLLTLHIRTKVYNYPLLWPARPSVFVMAIRCAQTPNDPFIKLLVEQRWDQIPAHDSGQIRHQLMANLGRSINYGGSNNSGGLPLRSDGGGDIGGWGGPTPPGPFG